MSKTSNQPISLDRRQFLAGSVATVAMTGTAGDTKVHPRCQAQEFYELRHYQIASAEKKQIVSNYLEKGLLPALNRMGIDRVGVFTALEDAEDLSIHVLIPYPTLDAFSELNPKLAKDKRHRKAATNYFGQPKKDPAYLRISSRFMKAFSSMPVIEMPGQTKQQQSRIFELRTYESHNEDAARRKVHMFDNGETELMRNVEMAPVFFGEMLVGDDVPNLTYMLSAANMEEHKAHWKAFLAHPEWDRMKKIPMYKGTVSKIRNWFLKPASFSQI